MRKAEEGGGGGERGVNGKSRDERRGKEMETMERGERIKRDNRKVEKEKKKTLTAGTALTILNNPTVQVIVFHPALRSMKPPQSGPTRVPPANAMLKSPYAWAYAPDGPKMPGRFFSLARMRYVISAMMGATINAVAQPMRTKRTTISTLWPIVFSSTNRRRTRGGRARTKPAVTSHLGPYRSAA